MTKIRHWLLANEIYWALRLAHACEGWAHNARQRLRKVSGKHSENSRSSIPDRDQR
jgi:hypothetical protein